MLKIVKTVAEWQDISDGLKGAKLGFVPTMGALHAGHMELIKRAVSENDIAIVSIFVNPTQFDEKEDFDKYIRNFADDCEKLEKSGVDFVFFPDEKEIYPDNYEVQVTENNIANILEGKFRAGHFTGMLSVVLKLLNIIRADKAYFGEKDFQQLLLVQKMQQALFLRTQIIACPIVREETGLAMSSRNERLSKSDRKKAALVYEYLSDKDLSLIEIKDRLNSQGFEVEYVEEKWGRRLIAVWLAGVRLIDNVKI